MTDAPTVGRITHNRNERPSGLPMRYEKPEEVIRLALMMQGSAEGISIEDIQSEHGVSRRTAERMRDAVLRLFPSAHEVHTGVSRKRWRIPSGTLNNLVAFSAEELGALQTAAAILERENLKDQAKAVADVAIKLQAALKREIIRRIAPDLEALTEAEGLAMRPGPQQIISEGTFEKLREAIVCRNEVTFSYRSYGSDDEYEHRVRPYGFLYGNSHYLVGWNTFESVRDFRLYSLSKISGVVDTGDTFTRDVSFSLTEYAKRSFGVFQEEPFDVAWKVDADYAVEAMEYKFHPSQTIQTCGDGSLIVRFRAGGAMEMCWHLFVWGGAIDVIEPLSLKQQLVDMCKVFTDRAGSGNELPSA